MKLCGQLKRSELEGGVWVFQADDGQSYHLDGLSPELERDGARLEVEGKLDRQGVTIGMMGALVRVDRARAL